MGFRLSPIFIKTNPQLSVEQLLEAIRQTHLKRENALDFYDTNKQYDAFFIGQINDYTILCNGALAYGIFDDAALFQSLQPTELTAIVWDETSGVFGFCCLQDGQIIRKVMAVDGAIECDEGLPLSEELAIDEATLFEPEEKEEIIEAEGEEAYLEILKAEKICRAANQIAKRYFGTALMALKDHIEVYEYR